jgi:hypothetical protein
VNSIENIPFPWVLIIYKGIGIRGFLKLKKIKKKMGNPPKSKKINTFTWFYLSLD